ncbi:MAG: amidohydrolase [Gammaproteobacteria bacterium]
MQDLSVTLLQSGLAWHDPATNRAHFEGMIGTLTEPTDIIVLPEMFSTGFTMDVQGQAETLSGPTVRWLAEMARRSGAVVCGSLVIEDGGRYYNRCLWAAPDGSQQHYDKRHLFRMAREHEHYAAGETRLVVDLKGWRICPLVCYDLRFPVWSRGANAFDLLLYVANWPAARRSAWQLLRPARAVENQCYVAGVNRLGSDGQGVDYAGDSGVHDYLGNPLADLGGTPGAHTAQLDGAGLVRYREKFPAWQDADGFRLAPQ